MADDETVLLKKELDEIHNWMRASLQLYFSWYAFFFVLNGTGVGYLFSSTSNASWRGVKYALFCFTFVAWNVLSIVTTIEVFLFILQRCDRIVKVNQILAAHLECIPDLSPDLPVPKATVKAVFAICLFALSVLLLGWAGLAIRIPRNGG